MANKRISDLPLVTTIADDDVLAIDGATTRSIAYADLMGSREVNTSGALTGGGDLSTSLTLEIAPNGVTYGLFQQVAANRLIGNPTGALANASEISLAARLTFSGSALDMANSGVSAGTYTSANVTVDAYGRVTAASSGSSPGTVLTSPEGRLTLSAGTPVMTSSSTGATSVYYTPYIGSIVLTSDGTNLATAALTADLSQLLTDTTKSPAAAAASSHYDMFIWLDGVTLRCTRGPTWSAGSGSNTVGSASRGTGSGSTELIRLNGVWVNRYAITNGPAAQCGVYVGTIFTNASATVDWTLGTTAAGGGAAVLGVWNAFNRVNISTQVSDTTDSWTYGTVAYRSANNSNTARVTFVTGLALEAFSAEYSTMTLSGASGAGLAAVGLNSTTAFTGVSSIGASGAITSGATGRCSRTVLGANFVQAIEAANTATNQTFYGDVGTPSLYQTGLVFSARM